jgi:hypothetical protein
MKRLFAVPLFLATLAASSPQPLVEVATGDWSQLPPLEHRSNDHLGSNGMARVFQLAARHQCEIPGYSYRKLDLRLSFAVRYNPDGTPARIVIPKLNCPEAEAIIGGAVAAMVKGRDYAPKSLTADQLWYRGTLIWGYEAELQSKI